MSESYDLTKLAPDTFEHMVNALALSVLGAGASGFGPGSDGGRDGFFEGEAPYPSSTEQWKGVWYIQSKFHAPHLSDDPQKWLLSQINNEIKEFTKPDTRRKWPNNWIIATNIDPSGTPETGAFDKAKALVKAARPNLESRFHIWGGAKILAFLTSQVHVAERYSHFLTPGNVLAAMMQYFTDDRADIDAILQQLVVTQFKEQKLTKLEQAGSQSDVKPLIHDLFVDLPFLCTEHSLQDDVMRCITSAARECHVIQHKNENGPDWRRWARHPKRARVFFLKGGPGHGKSTVGQYFSQLQRAALLLADHDSKTQVLRAQHTEYETAEDVKKVAEKAGFWPTVPRIPLHVELKDYAQWYGKKKKGSGPKGILTFVSEVLADAIEQPVKVGTLKRALKNRYWVAIFDGLDEVPHDVKDKVAEEVTKFVDGVALEHECDLLSICTSRPQGYSGQFRELDCAAIDLLPLPPETALACARPVISFQRPQEESRKAIKVLEAAAGSSSVRELLTTPLQAHILAVVVRDGERPPDRRWKLYHRFYDVIRRREANRDLPDARLARLLREDEKLLKTLHNRVGFRLQADAETSKGAETNLDRDSFRTLASRTVAQMEEDQFEEKVDVLDKATTERLVLINTPENGTKLRFDIRQLQEFFAAECLYESVKAEEMRSRIALIAGDAHWREVIHFLLSSLVENDRSTELSVAIEELCRQNDGDTEGADRMLNRRAGKGALIAARLLSEGVLEQDKATRQRFRDCLTPMAAFANVNRLNSLIDVRHANSLTWLINFLLDKLRESAYAENIGAAIVLCYVLPDGHSRVAELTQFLSKAPGNYVAAVIESYIARWRDRDRIVPTQWLISFLLQLLSNPNVGEIGVNGAFKAAWIIDGIGDSKNASYGAIAPQYIPLIGFLRLSWQDRPVELTFGNGSVRVIAHRHIPALDEAKKKLSPSALVGEAPGIFRIVQLALLYSESPSRLTYSALLRGISDAGCLRLPPLFAALNIRFPKLSDAGALSDTVTIIEGMTDQQFHKWVNETKMCVEESFSQFLDFAIERHPVNQADNIKAFIEDSPASALELIVVMSQDGRFKTELGNALVEVVSQLIPLLLSNPTLLLYESRSWHFVLSNAGDDANALRNLLFEECRKSMPYNRLTRHSPAFHRFRSVGMVVSILKLFNRYNEPSVLPYLTDLMLLELRMYGDLSRHHTYRQEAIPSELASTLRECQAKLNSIMNDNSCCWSIRCSAAILLMFVVDSKTSPVSEISQLFVDNCGGPKGQWLIEGLVTTLSISDHKQTPSLTSLMRDMFDSCREDYCTRASLEQVLMYWRETSTAPVTTAGVRDKWLYRSDV